METILYMGSKKEVVGFIERSINQFLGDSVQKTFFDVFCGSGRVAFHFRDKYQVTTADKQLFTKVIMDAYLCNTYPREHYVPLVNHLNSLSDEYLEETDKWYSETYGTDYNDGVSVGVDGKPKIWQNKNAVKIDMIRHRIEEMWSTGSIDNTEKSVLLLSLILAVNKISNMVGHQNGYLRDWCKHSSNDLILKVPKVSHSHTFNHRNYVGDVFALLSDMQQDFDIAYVDPPYGTNNKSVSISTVGRYTTFYHLWNTLVENHKPQVWGMANKPMSIKGKTFPLEMNVKAIVIPKFVRLIEELKAKIVVFSYSNQGLLSPKDFEKVFEWGGCDMSSLTLYRTPHKMNNQTVNAKKGGEFIQRDNASDCLYEYLFIAKKKEEHTRVTKAEDTHKEYEDIGVVNKWLMKPEDRGYLPKNTLTFIDGQFLTQGQVIGVDERSELSLMEMLGL